MKVLVTGAAGFLGRAFVRSHLRSGDDVWGVDDLSNPNSYWPTELARGHRFQHDASLFLAREGLAPRWDVAYHFAAPVGGRLKIDGDPLFNADSLRLDAAFFRWATTGGSIGLAVYPSSSAVYPKSLQTVETHAPLAESLFSPALPWWGAPDQVYGFTKLTGEYLAWKSAGYGLSTLCIRPFSGYGPDQGLDYPVPAIARRVVRRDHPIVIWGSGEQTRDFVHIEDLVAATRARADAGVEGYAAMNIGSGVATSIRQVAEAMMKACKHTAEIATDEDKPVGVANRYADTTLMSRYYQLRMGLPQGLETVLDAARGA